MTPLSDQRNKQAWENIRQQLDLLTSSADQRQVSQDALEEKLAKRARALRKKVANQQSLTSHSSILVFRKGSERFGVELRDVVEVQPFQHFSPVPQTPSFIRGLVHCRGDLLTLIDIARLLGVYESGLADIHYYIVVEAGGLRVAVVAEKIEDIFLMDQEQLKTVSQLRADVPSSWIRGIFHGDCLILNIEEVLKDDRMTEWKSFSINSST